MNLEETCFGIISYAGDAFATMREAIVFARNADIDSADQYMHDAQETLLSAQKINKVLMGENVEQLAMTLLIVHAQDTLMNAVMFESVAEELIEMYRTR